MRRVRPRRVGLFALLGLGLGALAGVVWWAVTDLPTYRVVQGGGAVTSERGLAGYIAADAWFVVCGAVVGLVLGVLGWRLFGRAGWPVVLVAVVVAALAGLVCWWTGKELGPGTFETRLAAAQPGDLVPVELTVRAHAALLVWPLFAVIPVLLVASLGRDPEMDPGADPTCASARASTSDRGDSRPGDGDEVGRGELDLKTPSPG